MLKKNKKTYDWENRERVIFVGGNGQGAIGEAVIDSQNDIFYKGMGLWNNEQNVCRISEVDKKLYTEIQLMDENKKLTGEKLKIYWFDFKDRIRYDFDNMIPQQIMKENEVLRSELQATRNNFDNMMRALEEEGIKSVANKSVLGIIGHYKKVLGNYGVSNPNMNSEQKN